MTYFSIFNSNINVQASFLLDRPRRDGKTGKGKNQGRGKEKNMMVEYIPLALPKQRGKKIENSTLNFKGRDPRLSSRVIPDLSKLGLFLF